MGLFNFFTHEIAIDLGTANTIIVSGDKVVVDEPSFVTVDNNTGKLFAIGEKAKQMHGKTHDNLRTIRPLRDGVIADFNAAEQMIRGMIKKVNMRQGMFSSKAFRVIVCVPSGSTEVEIRAVRDSAEHAGAREVYMIYEPMAAIIGHGIDIQTPEGNMVVDIGGGTSEIAVVSLGGIVTNQSIRIAGDEMNREIMEYMKQKHNIRIGERTAEEIKINVGAAMVDIPDPPEGYLVRGPHQVTALPVEVVVTHRDIAEALDKSVAKIESAILQALENTPPELYADVAQNGIFIAGGGALLLGLNQRFEQTLNIPCHTVEDPLRAVVRGTANALKNLRNYPFLLR